MFTDLSPTAKAHPTPNHESQAPNSVFSSRRAAGTEHAQKSSIFDTLKEEMKSTVQEEEKAPKPVKLTR